MTNPTPSLETQREAMQIAKATQKSNQTKEQTKLVAQGIEKGIALYKKQQKVKARERDKDRKKQLRQKETQSHDDIDVTEASAPESMSGRNGLPWVLLALSWVGFAAYLLITR
ncbi:DUF2956 domain-containing protein [Enterovibrio sp. 27052020O]|uniref:DUF2956 domain-containing protein n=1 Tax=Enterovibrio sp. 27052020O TaxID=3241166 RepID=UPI00388E37F0